ncbi:MAG: hypothetical protein JNK66_00455 [Chitinophagales bacterium]|nr:hypothetical protein [Chitinophagales bacterium]
MPHSDLLFTKRFWYIAIIASTIIAGAAYLLVEKNTVWVEEQRIPKGELAFLAQYDGRMPDEVGFLTNHILERRIANLIKDSMDLVAFRKYTAFGDTIHVQHNMVSAVFKCDSTLPSDCRTVVLVDLLNEAIILTITPNGQTRVYSDGYVENP